MQIFSSYITVLKYVLFSFYRTDLAVILLATYRFRFNWISLFTRFWPTFLVMFNLRDTLPVRAYVRGRLLYSKRICSKLCRSMYWLQMIIYLLSAHVRNFFVHLFFHDCTLRNVLICDDGQLIYHFPSLWRCVFVLVATGQEKPNA